MEYLVYIVAIIIVIMNNVLVQNLTHFYANLTHFMS